MEKKLFLAILVTALSFTTTTVNSAQLNLSNVPLYLGGAIDSNVMFMIDDSGSMHFELMPEKLRTNDAIGPTYMIPRGTTGIYGSGDNSVNNVPSFRFRSSETADINEQITAAYYRSSAHNTAYYNPAVTYIPWRNDNNTGPYVSWGGTTGNATPTSAYYHPIRTGKGSINLTIANTTEASWVKCIAPNPVNTDCSVTKETRTFYPAVYYHFLGGEIWNINNYQQVEIRSTTPTYSGHGRENRSECIDGVCTYQQEIQNFANWYTYYRSRLLTSQASIGRAFAAQRENMRVGFGTINAGSSTIDGVSTQRIVRGVRPFLGANRTQFFDQLYGRTYPFSGTPLREALEAAGQYFSRTDSKGPWGLNPGSGTEASSEHLMCRQSFTVLMTDGYWSDTSFSGTGNQDGTDGPVIARPEGAAGENFQYTPVNPFSDSYSNTLADVAMKYWKNDLRPLLDNKVPTTKQNPAFWQHMGTFGVSLGLSGTISPETAFNAISTNSTINWPQPVGFTSSKIDDLLHAAVNSRGGFFSANDPETFAEELSGVLSNIVDRTSSSASVALNSGSISSESKVYQARFNSEGWTGQLLAFPIDVDEGTLGSAVWDARDLIPAENSRVIFTSDETGGKPFRWANLATSQGILVAESLVNYIRGDQSLELDKTGGIYRERNFILGDIINSSPAYVAAPVQRYSDSWGPVNAVDAKLENASPYSTFKTAQKDRQPIVYVGANDGMLHAFNAESGAELFAYVPHVLFNKLPALANPNYIHKNYVDGSPTVVDAFINSEWKTVLVSGLGEGGQGIFALDVTNPSDFTTESIAATKVLWEFTDEDDKELGFTYGQPSIVRLQNGKWAAIFSGGYNNTLDNNQDGDTATDSTSGNAFLYIVDLQDGTLISKIDTEVGAANDPTGQNRPNGLASPAAIDANGDFTVDFVYAGDLFGNMWKFDLTDTDTTKWGIAYRKAGKPQALYTACFGETCNAANLQSITTRPQVVRHPTSNGFLVLFGTGKYLETNDNSINNQVTQTFYGIWDKNQSSLSAFNRTALLQQQITDEVAVGGDNYRVTSDNSVNWTNDLGWYVDLLSPNATSNLGERQVSNAIIRNGRIIFTTLLPSDDPCDFGGSGWLMELNFATGARLSYSPFDITGEGAFSVDDYICIANCQLDAEGNPDPERVEVPASGKQSGVGIIATPSIATDTGGQREFKYTSGSSGNIEVTVENPGPGFEGRQSWRQLEFIFR